jgi:hypothetical protein
MKKWSEMTREGHLEHRLKIMTRDYITERNMAIWRKVQIRQLEKRLANVTKLTLVKG